MTKLDDGKKHMTIFSLLLMETIQKDQNKEQKKNDKIG
jgi:hypothetical protein